MVDSAEKITDTEWLNHWAKYLEYITTEHSISIGDGEECDVIQMSVTVAKFLSVGMREIAGRREEMLLMIKNNWR